MEKKIQFKLEVGQDCCFMHDNQIKGGQVESRSYAEFRHGSKIGFTVKFFDGDNDVLITLSEGKVWDDVQSVTESLTYNFFNTTNSETNTKNNQ